MSEAQRYVLVALLIAVGAALSFIFLSWGEGAFTSLGGDRIAILVLRNDHPDSLFGSGYGLYTLQGIPGVLLGLIVPLCLFGGAAFVALGLWKRQ